MTREISSTRTALRRLREARAERVRLARQNVNVFIELAGVDDSARARAQNAGRVVRMVQHPVHVRMQRLIDEHKRLVLMTSPGLGKTSQLVLRMVWEIGRNPDTRIMVASKDKTGEGTGSKIVKQIRQYIQSSPEVKEVFPHLRPGHTWKESIFVVQRSTFAKDGTVQLGAAGKFAKGSRLNWIILDDWYDEESAESSTERKRLIRWVQTVADRLEEDGQMVACCNAIHPEDPAHFLERMALERPEKFGWHVARIPVYEPADYDIDLDSVRLTLPEFWPVKRILEMRDSMTELEFTRLYLCSARDEAGSAFDHEAVSRAFRDPDEPEGEGDDAFSTMTLRDQRELGCQVVVGVDFAVKKHAKADKTVLTAVAYWPKEDVRQVLWIESGRWRSDFVARKILEFDRRFRPAIIMLETSGQQEMIFGAIALLMELHQRDAEPDESVPYPPCQGYTTNAANKWHSTSGVESVSTQLSNGRWIFPALKSRGASPIHSELAQLKAGMIGYVRGKHTSDHLMSLWLANEGIRLIAYSETDTIQERESERAMVRIEDLYLRWRPPQLDDDFVPTTPADYLVVWNALQEMGVDLSEYDDDFYALFELMSEDVGDESGDLDIESEPFLGVNRV